MTPRQIGLVTETLGSSTSTLLAADFYRRVFDDEPGAGDDVHDRPAVQRTRFAAELATLVGSIR